MPVPTMVRNMQSGPTVFHDEATKQTIEWAGKGDPLGGDVQPVPDGLIANVQFQRSIYRGILGIEQADEEIQRVLAAQRGNWEMRMQAQKDAGKQALDQVADNDMIQVPCIGPSERGIGLCGQPIPVRAARQYEQPPLCNTHKSLAKNFIAEETGRLVAGKPEKTWSRVTMGALTHQD